MLSFVLGLRCCVEDNIPHMGTTPLQVNLTHSQTPLALQGHKQYTLSLLRGKKVLQWVEWVGVLQWVELYFC